MLILKRPWTRQPSSASLSEVGNTAFGLVNSSNGVLRNKTGQLLTDLYVPAWSARTLRNDGTYIYSRNENGILSAGRYQLAVQPSIAPSAVCFVHSFARANIAQVGYAVAWSDTATSARCHIQITSSTFTISLRQGVFDTPRVENYDLTHSVRSTWSVRAIAGVGISVWRDGALLTPSASSGTMPATSFFNTPGTAIWFGGPDEYSGYGAHYGSALWFSDLGPQLMADMSLGMYRVLYSPKQIYIPTNPPYKTLSSATWTNLTATSVTPRVTWTQG